MIPLGAPGSYDAGCILGVSNAVTSNDEIWVYYTAITTTHVGRASWRLDGFASLHAGKGDITTVPLPLAGKRVLVNAGAAGGRVEVEVLDAAGKPIAGFARGDCCALSSAGVRQPVRWKGGERVPAPAKSLRVFLEDADLYAIRLEAAPAKGN